MNKAAPQQEQLFDPDPLLDKEAAARRLGVGMRFVTRLIAERRIAYVKVGKHIRIKSSTIDQFIVANTISAHINQPARTRYEASGIVRK